MKIDLLVDDDVVVHGGDGYEVGTFGVLFHPFQNLLHMPFLPRVGWSLAVAVVGLVMQVILVRLFEVFAAPSLWL